MKCVIEVEMDNVAFIDNPYELADVLEFCARVAKRGEMLDERSLFDVNGNNVGDMKIVDEEAEDMKKLNHKKLFLLNKKA